MKKHCPTKRLKHTAKLKLKYTVASIQTLQENLYLLSDEQLKKESDELIHDAILWLNRWFSFSEIQYQMIIAINHQERTKLAFELSFALENRLPVLLNYSEQWDSLFKSEYLEEGSTMQKISCYWESGILKISLNKNITGRNNLCSAEVSKQLTEVPNIDPKATHPIIAKSTRFDHLIKYPHEF